MSASAEGLALSPARLTPQEKLFRQMSEQELVDKALQLAGMAGWWWHHTRPAWTARGFKTPLGGMVGFPDYVFARTRGVHAIVTVPPEVTEEQLTQLQEALNALPTADKHRLEMPSYRAEMLIVEFKTELGGYGPGQEEWARRLEPTGAYRLWRPSSWPSIEKELIGK